MHITGHDDCKMNACLLHTRLTTHEVPYIKIIAFFHVIFTNYVKHTNNVNNTNYVAYRSQAIFPRLSYLSDLQLD